MKALFLGRESHNSDIARRREPPALNTIENWKLRLPQKLNIAQLIQRHDLLEIAEALHYELLLVFMTATDLKQRRYQESNNDT